MTRSSLTPFERMKILSIYTEAKELHAGGLPYPRMAIVYPSYICNQHCVGCLCEEWNRQHHTFMDENKIPALVQALISLKVKSVELSGGGEPTLHPAFAQLAISMANEGLELGLLTNGTRLDGELLEAVVSYFTYVRISVDAHRRELYDQIRRPSRFAELDRVIANIRRLRIRRDEAGCSLRIGAKVLLSKVNGPYVTDIVKFCRDLGFDYVQFKPLRNSRQSLEHPEVEKVNARLAESRNNSPGIPIYGGVSRSSYVGKCWLTPIHVVIDPLGDVYPCCYYEYRSDRMWIGNVFRNSIEEIWLGARHREVLAGLNVDECNLYDCRWHFYNRIMDEVFEENSLHVNFV